MEIVGQARIAKLTMPKHVEGIDLPRLEDLRPAVIGLGYVGLPLAIALGGTGPTIGFDLSTDRVGELRAGRDTTGEISEPRLSEARKQPLRLTDRPEKLAAANCYILTVPTPIDAHKRPDLSPLLGACRVVGEAMSPGDLVVIESTVYPGATEEDCVPVLEHASGLRLNRDFWVGYSPERTNPGDREHRLQNVVKVTSGSTPEAADLVDALYRQIITAGMPVRWRREDVEFLLSSHPACHGGCGSTHRVSTELMSCVTERGFPIVSSFMHLACLIQRCGGRRI